MHDEQNKPVMEQDWREVPRSVMFNRVMAAVDGHRLDCQINGDTNYVRYCEEQLFPFLEEMKTIAELHEMLQENK